ncbi:MAG TPA: hypothetical protein VFE38_00550 [Edaphobacter sp.]|nr:hypothetical protein [Edaphobacter sp.]
MQSRLMALKRLASLYGDVEEMHSVELQRANAAVREAEQAIGAEQRFVRSSNVEGRRALAAGDRLDWRAAQMQREMAEWRQQRLQQVHRERELVNDEAMKRYVASRTQSEQMKHMARSVTVEVETEVGRRAQEALDDRFLARRRWTDLQEEKLRKK